MSFRNTLALAVLFVAVGAYLYFVESEKIEEEAAKATLLDVETEKVDGLRLEYPAEQRVMALRKTTAGWQLQEPIEARADQTAAENLVRAVVDAELTRTLDEEVGPPETYGLDKPSTIVTLHLDDGSNLPAIRVGKKTPVGYSAFVQIEGESSVKLVSSAFATGMEKQLNDLRDKEILSFDDTDVRRIEIDVPAAEEPDVELVRKDEDWELRGGDETLTADEAEVRSFLSSLRSMRAEDFLDQPESLESLGLESPRRRITLWVGKDEVRQQILVGNEAEREGKKELYVRRDGQDTIYAVASYAWSNLGKTRHSFRDKTVLALDREQLGAIEVLRADGESFRIVRSPEPAGKPEPGDDAPAPEAGWIVDGEAERSRAAQINQLVGDVHGLEGYEVAAERPTDLSAYGLASPAFTFSMTDRDGKPLGRILVAQVAAADEGANRSYAMAEGGTLVYRVRDYLYAHLDKKREDLLEPPAAAAAEAEPQTDPAPAADEP